ncbi:MAG: hypothetical protein LBI13_11450 [Streptococcaceae bacterium]|jgi:hypothetical protein|nr:hypothetical protein [Streptococcaceae bacterium]
MIQKNTNSRIEKFVSYDGATALTTFASSPIFSSPYIDSTSKYGIYEGNSNIYLYEMFEKYTTGTAFDQLDGHQLYGGGHYFNSTHAGVKSVLENGSIQLETLNNSTHDWVLVADGHYIGPVTLFYMTTLDSNNSYHRVTFDIQGAGVFTIGKGLLDTESIQTIYIGLHSIFTAKELSFCRYKSYVHLWNEIIHRYGAHSNIGSALSAEEGSRHHAALIERYDKDHIPPFVRFSDAKAEDFDSWADSLESGLVWAIRDMNALTTNGHYAAIPKEFAPYMLPENRAKLFN